MDVGHEADLVALFIDGAGFGNLLSRAALAEGVDDGVLVRGEEVFNGPGPEEGEDVGAAAVGAGVYEVVAEGGLEVDGEEVFVGLVCVLSVCVAVRPQYA